MNVRTFRVRVNHAAILATTILAATVGLPALAAAQHGGGHGGGGFHGGGGGAHYNSGGSFRANAQSGTPHTFSGQAEHGAVSPQTRYYHSDQNASPYHDSVDRNWRNNGNWRGGYGYGYWPYAYGLYNPWGYGFGYGYGPGYNNGNYDDGYYNDGYFYGNNGYAPTYTTQNSVNYGGGAFLGVDFDTRFPDSAIVKNVHDNTAAAEAGLRPGDTIISVNGHAVHSWRDVTDTVRQSEPGEAIRIRVGGARSRTVEAVLGSRA